MLRHHGQHGDDCFACRIKSVTVSPSATPTRRNQIPPKVSETSNNWEKGIVRDDRGMPYLEPNLEPIGLKEWVNNPKYKEKKARLDHEVSVSRSSQGDK